MENPRFGRGIRIAAGSGIGLLRTLGEAIDHANELTDKPVWDAALEAARQALYGAYEDGQQAKVDAARDAYQAALKAKKLAFDS